MQLALPISGKHAISRHHSAQAAEQAARTRGRKTLAYLQLLAEVGELGVTDHDTARMMGCPLSSVNSIRNGCGDLVVPAAAPGVSPWGRTVTKWRRR